MKTPLVTVGAVSALVLSLSMAPANVSQAQQADDMEEVVVTGSRIRRNPLDEPVGASPAVAGGRIYIRGHKHLFSIGDAPSS